MHAYANLARDLDGLPSALYAAEFGEPFDLSRAPTLPDELFAAVPELRVSVPFATLRLLERLATDERIEVRVGVARALPWFVELYPRPVDELLLQLACDGQARVRNATAEPLADLLESSSDAEAAQLIERWQWHPDRARQVLARARARLPGPIGTR